MEPKSHVNSILFKLDYTSRTQIATWAIEKGLTRENAKAHRAAPTKYPYCYFQNSRVFHDDSRSLLGYTVREN